MTGSLSVPGPNVGQIVDADRIGPDCVGRPLVESDGIRSSLVGPACRIMLGWAGMLAWAGMLDWISLFGSGRVGLQCRILLVLVCGRLGMR